MLYGKISRFPAGGSFVRRRQAAVLPRDAGKVVGCMVKKMFSGCPYAYL